MNKLFKELRAALSAEEEKQSGSASYFNYWNMPDGAQCTVRFLPDGNTDNPLGFVEAKKTHSFHFSNGVNRSVPCNTMFGDACPICSASKGYYKNNDKENGKKYYRNLGYVAQALIVESSVPVKDGEESPVGKVKLVSVNYWLWKVIQAAFESGGLNNVPYDYENGFDFIIKKYQKASFSSYDSSYFARESTTLTDDQIAFVQSEIVELSTVLPAQKDSSTIDEMLEASMTGRAYIDKKNDDIKVATQPVSKTVGTEATQSAVKQADEDKADEVIAAIKARKLAQQQKTKN